MFRFTGIFFVEYKIKLQLQENYLELSVYVKKNALVLDK
jgi:hypothetical protein